MTDARLQRVLVIDDNVSIHEDYRKVLVAPAVESSLDELSNSLFGGTGASSAPTVACDIEYATQGQTGVELCRSAVERGSPFTMAFVDMRMPPGWDGLRTIQELWKVDARLEIVLCTAFSDHSIEEISTTLGTTDKLLLLKKPFDRVEILQLSRTLGEKWQLERRLEQRISNLAGEVDARTSELKGKLDELARTNADLRQAMVAAGAASRAKEEFLANMSHELRTPLTAILGFVDLISDTDPSAEILDHVKTIRRNGEHLLALLNDVLDLSKLQAGALRIESIPCSPRAIVEEVVVLMGELARLKGIGLSATFVGAMPSRVRADPLRLRQVLVQLVGNAVKFTVSGAVEVRVAWLSGSTLELCVKDSGIGLSDEELAQLFRPFSQADASTARKFGGTGLGLSISRRLADLQQGSIHVESKLGVGSTFTFRVPCVVDSADPPAPAAPLPFCAPRAGSLEERSLENRRVLIVDDSRDNQRLIQSFLKRAGAVVTVAEDGRQGVYAALAARQAGQPHDLILMDMMMPVLDGYQATAELRSQGVSTPILALTAHVMTGDEDRCLAAGCNAYAGKPIDRVKLLETCNALLAAVADPLRP